MRGRKRPTNRNSPNTTNILKTTTSFFQHFTTKYETINQNRIHITKLIHITTE